VLQFLLYLSVDTCGGKVRFSCRNLLRNWF